MSNQKLSKWSLYVELVQTINKSPDIIDQGSKLYIEIEPKFIKLNHMEKN